MSWLSELLTCQASAEQVSVGQAEELACLHCNQTEREAEKQNAGEQQICWEKH